MSEWKPMELPESWNEAYAQAANKIEEMRMHVTLYDADETATAAIAAFLTALKEQGKARDAGALWKEPIGVVATDGVPGLVPVIIRMD